MYKILLDLLFKWDKSGMKFMLIMLTQVLLNI